MQGFRQSFGLGLALGVGLMLTHASSRAALGPPSIKRATTAHVLGPLGHLAPTPAAPSASSPGTPSSSGSAAHIVSRSVGSPTEGHLVGGAHLDDAPYLRGFPCYAERDVRWGLDALVTLLDHAARAVRKQFPDSVMSVGHLSRQNGGEVDRHASHESGRDADVGFYIKNQAGKPIYAEHMVAFKGDGTAPSWPGAHFDDARNWALVTAMVSDGHAKISHIFVATPIRARLLAYAEHIGAPHAIRQRAAEVMAQPRGALPHDDHFHVRIMCPNAMEGCIELPTMHAAERFARGPKAGHGRLRGVASRSAAGGTSSPAAGGSPASSPPTSIPSPNLGSLIPSMPTPPAAHASSPRKNAPKLDNADAPAVPAVPSSDVLPDFPVDPSAEAEGTNDAPPASMTAPIDDVDGPLPFSAP